jgi:outer membrane protein OmpA-like peptidoglycan-associated protein
MCLIILFSWSKNFYPFETNVNNVINAPKINTDKAKPIQNANETTINNDISLGFAKPLDTLTKSITKLNDFKELITNENTIPVIGVIFKYNSVELSKEGINILEDFVENYKKINVKNYLLIEGYSCVLGTQEYNLKLSENRAFSLESELIKLGIKKETIKLMPLGKIKFVSSKNHKNDLEINRRSNITIIPIN